MKFLTLFLLMIVLIMPACSSAAADLTTPPVQPPTPSPEEPASPESSDTTPQSPVEPPAEPTLPPGDTASLEGTRWTLESFGTPGAETPAVAGSTVTLQFEADGQAGGSGGCNSYGGQYEIQADTISFSQIVSTLMACADESVTQQEQQYFEALQTDSRFEAVGDQLTIWYNSDQGVLNFVKASP